MKKERSIEPSPNPSYSNCLLNQMLTELLTSNGEYALAMGPGFFRFYAHAGILQALDELSLLKPSHVSGSSAGAMIGCGIAAGLKPADIAKELFTVKREDIWDMGSSALGLLKGRQ